MITMPFIVGIAPDGLPFEVAQGRREILEAYDRGYQALLDNYEANVAITPKLVGYFKKPTYAPPTTVPSVWQRTHIPATPSS